MILRRDTREAYPELTRFLTLELPGRVFAASRVLNALAKWSGMDPASVKAALFVAATSPEIRVRKLSIGTRCAEYNFDGIIAIDNKFMSEWELSMSGFNSGAIVPANRPPFELLLEATILHEFVHWGYHQLKLAWGHMDFREDTERGFQFEKAAYDGIVTPEKLGITGWLACGE